MTADSTTPRIAGLDGLHQADLDALRTLHIEDENDLAYACRTNKIRDIPALGPDVQRQVTKALRTTPWSTATRTLAHARGAAARVLDALQRDGSALRLAVAGGVRRMARSVDEVKLLATAHDPEALIDAFAGLSFVVDTERTSETTVEGTLRDGTAVRLEVWPEDPPLFFARWVELTGDEKHWHALVEHAAKLSHRLEPYGLFHDDDLIECVSEAGFYDRLGLPLVPPEQRTSGWIDAPDENLVTIGDLKGLVHVHTDAAAGVFPVQEIARRAMHEGYEWVVIADRSPTAFPKGLALDQLDAQRAAVDETNADPEIEARVFLGVEARVLPDGSLDWPDEALDAADVVIGVVEDPPGDEDTSPNAVTDRFVKAVSHPRVHVLAHPRFESVGGLPAPEWERVFPAAVAAGTAFELCGESHRVLYDTGWHAAARRAGAFLVPSADAYDIDGVDNVICAVGGARRGGWTVLEVMPTRSAANFAAWLEER